MIENRLLVIDSLMSYGKVNEALAKIEPLRPIAKTDPRVRLTLKKVEFEHWKEKASAAFSISDYTSADEALDSALSRFPNQPWCLNLRLQIDSELGRTKAIVSQAKEEVPEKLSPQLLREVDEAYKNGQKLFKEGKLPEAVSQWEKVERLAPDYMSVRQYLVNAYKFVGVELYGQNHLNEAIDIWKKAAKLAPDNIEIEGYIRRTENERLKLQELSYEYK
jgi:tetratricopeptide (TPR) repeat protein